MSVPTTRESILETCFCDLPQKLGKLELRPLSAGSFTLLGRLRNPMMGGSMETQEQMFDAVMQYAWIHSAPIEAVLAIQTAEDIPEMEIRKLAFGIEIGQALGFLQTYTRSAIRMSASLAEIDPEEDDTPGKPVAPEPAPAGSLPSSMPSADVPILRGSDTSFGSSPSSEPSPTSTPQTSQTEPAAAGLVILPEWTPVNPPPTPS